MEQVLERAIQYSKKLLNTETLHVKNHQLCKEIVDAAMKFYEVSQDELDVYIRQAENEGRLADRISVQQSLKHFVRDYSVDGSHERLTFPCILGAIQELSSELHGAANVLVPGAGLGRLGHDIAALGGESSFPFTAGPC